MRMRVSARTLRRVSSGCFITYTTSQSHDYNIAILKV